MYMEGVSSDCFVASATGAIRQAHDFSSFSQTVRYGDKSLYRKSITALDVRVVCFEKLSQKMTWGIAQTLLLETHLEIHNTRQSPKFIHEK